MGFKFVCLAIVIKHDACIVYRVYLGHGHDVINFRRDCGN